MILKIRRDGVCKIVFCWEIFSVENYENIFMGGLTENGKNEGDLK